MSFKLIVISSPASIPNETELITSLFKAGLQIFHLRKPGMSKVKMKKIISSFPKKYHSRIVIHSNHGLINEFKLKGIHFTEKEREKRKMNSMRSKRKKGITYSTSWHLDNNSLIIDGYDHIFFSPVFDSISKSGYKSDFEISDFKRFFTWYNSGKEKQEKIIALGGVSEKNVLKLKSAGFHGAAVLGAIWMSKDPVKSFKRIEKKLN